MKIILMRFILFTIVATQRTDLINYQHSRLDKYLEKFRSYNNSENNASVLNQCLDLNQKSVENLDFHLNDRSLLQQVVSKSGLIYYLIETEGWIYNIDQGFPNVDTSYFYGTKIKVRSVLSLTNYYLLTEEDFECNQTEESDLCPTQNQEQAENEIIEGVLEFF